jgi:phosphopantetheinyl transferase
VGEAERRGILVRAGAARRRGRPVVAAGGSRAAPPGRRTKVGPDERRRAARFRSDQARALFVQGRSLLRQVLATYLGCPPQMLRLDQWCVRCGAADHGKPRLVSPPSELTFNLSHAEGLVVVAVCCGQPVGVDVEWRGRAQAMPELVGLVLSPTELAALEELPQADRAGVLLRCWVRKEALLKATGEGLGRGPRAAAAAALAQEPRSSPPCRTGVAVRSRPRDLPLLHRRPRGLHRTVRHALLQQFYGMSPGRHAFHATVSDRFGVYSDPTPVVVRQVP